MIFSVIKIQLHVVLYSGFIFYLSPHQHPTLCVVAVMDLVRLCKCAALSDSPLLSYAISTKF